MQPERLFASRGFGGRNVVASTGAVSGAGCCALAWLAGVVMDAADTSRIAARKRMEASVRKEEGWCSEQDEQFMPRDTATAVRFEQAASDRGKGDELESRG